ncbi:MAG: hypothetical protein IKO93_18985, partial [Lentisphaeria bacterium]|nr:hypothetical protein [Lentisphaeria bacterium]
MPGHPAAAAERRELPLRHPHRIGRKANISPRKVLQCANPAGLFLLKNHNKYKNHSFLPSLDLNVFTGREIEQQFQIAIQNHIVVNIPIQVIGEKAELIDVLKCSGKRSETQFNVGNHFQFRNQMFLPCRILSNPFPGKVPGCKQIFRNHSRNGSIFTDSADFDSEPTIFATPGTGSCVLRMNPVRHPQTGT